MRKKFIVAALIFSSRIAAQEVPADSTYLMDEVIVTGYKYPKKQSNTGKVVSVIDRTMLEQMQARSLGEILNMASGTTINGANNTPGTNQRISIRGGADGNVLLLIDGIPVNDPSVISNYFDLNFLSPANVERIEILKGGQSTIYGSDAVAGVINVITKKPETGTRSADAFISYGSYGTARARASYSASLKKFSYRLSGEHNRSKGFSAAYDSTGAAGFDNDAFRQNNIQLETAIAFSPLLQLQLRGSYGVYNTDVDAGAFRDDKDFTVKNKNGRAALVLQWQQPKGRLRFQYHVNYIDRFYLDDSTDKGSFGYYSESSYGGTTHFAELFENLRLKNWELLAGADFRYQSTAQDYFSVSDYGEYRQPTLNKNAAQVSGYASAVYQKKSLTLETGGRWNHHNAYGSNFTYTFNPAYTIADKWKLFFNLSSAYKVPSLFQLYDAFAGFSGLNPESSAITEAGISMLGNQTNLRLTAFHQSTRDAIQYIITDPQTYSGHYANVNAQKNYGLETELNYRSENWRLQANYTYTQDEVHSGFRESGEPLAKDTVYNNLYRVPAHAANLFAGYKISDKFQLSSLLKYVGSRLEPVFAAAPLQLDGYATVDLSLRYRPNENAALFLDLNNVTNSRYFDVTGYNSRRFNFTSGIQLHF
ncbi:MAG: TonB-dependent receptor plug domain-containing protein [Flavisolibacter sp.]